MLRKILIAVVASLSLLSPLALPAQSEAREATYHRHAVCVYVRDCSREPWRFYGRYSCREDAFHAARHLQRCGFDAFVR